MPYIYIYICIIYNFCVDIHSERIIFLCILNLIFNFKCKQPSIHIAYIYISQKFEALRMCVGASLFTIEDNSLNTLSKPTWFKIRKAFDVRSNHFLFVRSLSFKSSLS